MINIFIYICIGFVLSRSMDAAGISLAESIAFTIEALIMIAILNIRFKRDRDGKSNTAMREFWNVVRDGTEARGVLVRTVLGSVTGGAVVLLVSKYGQDILSPVVLSMVAMLLGLMVVIPFIWREVKQLVRL